MDPTNRTVTIDATALLDLSGNRGIGRYVRDLLHGLAATRDEWSSDFDLRIVTGLGFLTGGETETDPIAALERLEPLRGSQEFRIRRRRQRALGSVAFGSAILHLAEPIGVPWLKRLPWSATCYDLIPLRLPEQYLGGRGLRYRVHHGGAWLRYRIPERLVAISEHTRTDLIELLGLRPNRVVHVPTGIDLSSWGATPLPDDRTRLERLGVGARPYVLYVGGGDPRKGVNSLLDALVAAVRHVDVDLVWTGNLPAAELREFRRLIGAKRIEDRVRLLGFTADPDLAALYRGALALPFLSTLEGFGLPVVEAMACSCPVIVVRGSGCDEISADAGYVVGAGDAGAASRAITELARDGRARAERGARGLARAQRFDRRRMARGYAEVWREMLHGRAR
jgi:glycosyltransferase involved in cell wall biosynthesis